MPWTSRDANRHNKKAKSGKASRQWAAVANSVLAKNGNDTRAVREANAVIPRRSHGLDSVRKFAEGGKVTRDPDSQTEKLREFAKTVESSHRSEDGSGANLVSRVIESPGQRGGMVGARAGYAPSDGLGGGVTVGVENVNGSKGVIKGADVQYKKGNQQFGVGAHDGPRGTRWALRYQRSF